MLNRSSCVLVLEFQRNNRPENQASLPHQAFIPVVQTSTPNCNVLQRCVLVLEFQGDSRENQASLPHQASVPVVQTSTPMWSWQEVLLRAEKGGGRSLVKPGKERTRQWNGCRAVVRCQQYLRLPRAVQRRTDGLPCLKELLTTYAFPYATTLQGSTTFPSLLTQPHTTRGFAGANPSYDKLEPQHSAEGFSSGRVMVFGTTDRTTTLEEIAPPWQVLPLDSPSSTLCSIFVLMDLHHCLQAKCLMM